MTANLKSCPFCGGEDFYFREQQNENVAFVSPIFIIECATCGALVHARTTEKAIEAWNHRPFEEKAVEVLAEKLYFIAQQTDDEGPYCYWIHATNESKDKYRAEAKQLLGVK